MIEVGVPHTHPYASIVYHIGVLPNCSWGLVFIHSLDQSLHVWPPCPPAHFSSLWLMLRGWKNQRVVFYISSFVYFALDKKINK